MFNLILLMMKVKELMTAEALVYCSLDTKLRNVAKIMKDANHGVLPVVDKNNKVLAMITDRDVCLAMASKTDKPFDDLIAKDAISNLMIQSVKPDEKISHALKEMRKNKIARLPVTDEDGKLKGIISINNILNHAIAKNQDLGQLSSDEENLARTITALFQRNSKHEKKTALEFETTED